MSPQIQLEDFAITRLHIDWIPPKDGPVKLKELQSEFDYNVAVQAKDNRRYKLELQLSFQEAGVEQTDIGFRIAATTVGVFVFEPNTTTEDRKRLVRINGVNILYGTFRGVLVGVTGAFPGGKFLLPTILPNRIVAEIEAKRVEPPTASVSEDVAANARFTGKRTAV